MQEGLHIAKTEQERARRVAGSRHCDGGTGVGKSRCVHQDGRAGAELRIRSLLLWPWQAAHGPCSGLGREEGVAAWPAIPAASQLLLHKRAVRFY